MKHSKYPQYCPHWAIFHMLCFNSPVMFVPSFTHCTLAQNFMFLCMDLEFSRIRLLSWNIAAAMHGVRFSLMT